MYRIMGPPRFWDPRLVRTGLVAKGEPSYRVWVHHRKWSCWFLAGGCCWWSFTSAPPAVQQVRLGKHSNEELFLWGFFFPVLLQVKRNCYFAMTGKKKKLQCCSHTYIIYSGYFYCRQFYDQHYLAALFLREEGGEGVGGLINVTDENSCIKE